MLARNRRLGGALGQDALEEVVQNVMVNVWSKLGQFEGRARLETWVYRFCWLEMANALRRRDRGRMASLDSTGEDAESTQEPSVTVPVDGGLRAAEAERLLERLSSREAEVVRRRLFAEQEVAEIANELGVSASTVKTHYQRALSKLRDTLGPRVGQESLG
ncbi:MAG: RNA polymerase sigma factor [Planctomycetota bacterium]